MRPRDFRPALYEATTRRVVTHLSHIEDIPLVDGPAAAPSVYRLLSNIGNLLRGDTPTGVNLSVKLDGSPSLVFGLDPEDGRFFVATKAAFSQHPTLIKSLDDVQRYYSGRPDLADILTTAFRSLKDLPWDGVVQGDVLCTPTRRQIRHIDGLPYVTFTPNTLTYGVPQESVLGQQVARADLTIAIHTRYTGSTLQTLVSAPITGPLPYQSTRTAVLVSSQYRDLSGTMGLTREESERLDAAMHTVATLTPRLRQNRAVHLLHAEPGLRALALRVANDYVRRRQPEPTTAYEYLTSLGQRATTPHLQGLVAQLPPMPIIEWLKWRQAVVMVKLLLLTKLTTVKDIHAYHDTGEGLVAGSHEGFVACTTTGTMVKLVDRSVFSYHNFTKARLTHNT